MGSALTMQQETPPQPPTCIGISSDENYVFDVRLCPKFIKVYPYAAQFVLLYYLRPLLPNSSHYLRIWNNAFHSDMACQRVVVGKKDEKFDL